MEVQNPIHVIRVEQGLSLRKAADTVPCHHQAFYMVEHGMYIEVLPKILGWAVNRGDKSDKQIQYEYMIFRAAKQDLAREVHSLDTIDSGALGIPGDNPVRKLRDYLGLTQSGFCKELCVPVALLYTAENTSVSLPGNLKRIFQDLGIRNLVIQEMVERYGLVER